MLKYICVVASSRRRWIGLILLNIASLKVNESVNGVYKDKHIPGAVCMKNLQLVNSIILSILKCLEKRAKLNCVQAKFGSFYSCYFLRGMSL